MDPDAVAMTFVEHYYSTFDANRAGLASLYQDGSMLTFEGQKIQGSQNIVVKLTGLPFQQCKHTITTVDCQPSGTAGGMLVFVSGNLQLAGEQHSLKFSQDKHLSLLESCRLDKGVADVEKIAKRNVCAYTVPDELGVLLNSMKRMLDVLRPKIETQFKSWGYSIPEGGNALPGERLSKVTVMLRAKFRNYVQAVVEKLAENTKLQSSTKLKKILQDSKDTVVESNMRSRMQPLNEQLTTTINHLHTLFENRIFIAICRGYWDRMGRDVLGLLENRKENRSWYKGCRVAVSILDDTFAYQMQQLMGNSLQEKDVEPPTSVMEVRSMLCKDASSHKENSYYF